MVRKLTAAALVVGLVAVSAFAQGTARNIREDRDANRAKPEVTAQHTYSELEIQAQLHDNTPTSIILSEAFDAEDIKLTRSFRDALKQNVDKESMTRQIK